MNTQPDLMTGPEVATILRQTPRGLAYWRKQGRGPGWIRLGKQVLYPREGVEKFLGELKDRAAAGV